MGRTRTRRAASTGRTRWRWSTRRWSRRTSAARTWRRAARRGRRARREERDEDEEGGLRPGDRRNYSPDHRPEQPHHDEEAAEQGDEPEAAIRRARTDVGHELQPDAGTDRPDDEQRGEQELRVRVGHPPDPARTALGRQRLAFEYGREHQRDHGDTDPERDGLLEGNEEQLHLASDASRWGAQDTLTLHRCQRAPFRRLGRFVARRARLVVAAWAVLIAVACRSRLRRPTRCGRAASSATTWSPRARRRCSSRSSACRRRRWSSCSTATGSPAGSPAFETAAAAAMATSRSAPRRPRRLASPAAAPGLGGWPHGVRRRPARPARRRLARCAADPARAPARRTA